MYQSNGEAANRVYTCKHRSGIGSHVRFDLRPTSARLDRARGVAVRVFLTTAKIVIPVLNHYSEISGMQGRTLDAMQLSPMKFLGHGMPGGRWGGGVSAVRTPLGRTVSPLRALHLEAWPSVRHQQKFSRLRENEGSGSSTVRLPHRPPGSSYSATPERDHQIFHRIIIASTKLPRYVFSQDSTRFICECSTKTIICTRNHGCDGFAVQGRDAVVACVRHSSRAISPSRDDAEGGFAAAAIVYSRSLIPDNSTELCERARRIAILDQCAPVVIWLRF